MKWIKRLLVTVCLAVILAAAAGGIGYRMLHGQPSWYTHGMPDSSQREEMARQVEHKLTDATSWSQSAWLAQQQPAALAKPDPLELSLTEAEINAFISKWDQLPIVGSQMPAMLSDPQVSLEEGRLILGATMKDLDAIVSVDLAPRIDSQGMLHLDVQKVMGGELPLPRKIWDAYARRLAGKIERELPQAEQKARCLPDGSANNPMVEAVLGRMMLHFLHGEPADPVVFMKVPVNNELRNLPVKITLANIADKTITMRVEPLAAGEKIDEKQNSER
jgi:hypothetical protein